MEAHFLYNPDSAGLHAHAPTIAILDDGDMLACWYAYPEEENKNGCLVFARRSASGGAWQVNRNVVRYEYSAGNPVLFQDSSGVVWLWFVVLKGRYWNDAQLQAMSSRDGGRTWSLPASISSVPGMMVRHPPIQLDDGRLILPAYDERASHSLLLASAPPYASWEELYRFSDLPLIQPVLVKNGDERLSIFFRPVGEPRRIWRSHSADQGRTWSIPIRTILPNPLSGIGAFATGSSIGVVTNYTENHQRHPLSLTLTSDGGVTWSEPWHFETIKYEVSYPSFLCDPSGKIHGVYTYNRRMIKYVSFDAGEMEALNGND